MTDSIFLEEVSHFLHSFDWALDSGNVLVQSLDKDPLVLSAVSTTATTVPKDFLDDCLASNAVQVLENLQESLHGMRNSCSDYASTDTESVRSSAPSPSHADTVESIRTRDAIRRSTYRKKQKAERTALHDQVKTLSSQLELLQKRVNGTAVQEEEGEEAGLEQGHLLMWKALADRQLQAKLLAEEQHGRYLEAVEHQSMLIRELGALVRKRIRDERQETSGSCLVKKARCESLDQALYETYIKNLDDVYAQTDRILEASAVNTSVSTSDENDELKVFYLPSKRAVKDATYHELVGKSTTPCSFDRVQAHIDRACRLDKLTGRTEVEGDWIPNNTAILKYQGSVPACRGKIVQLHVARKYFEGHRIVIVWKTFTEGEGDCAGMHADETGWCVLQPSLSSVEGCAGTLLESVTRLVPMNFSCAVSGAKEKLFTDAIIKVEEEMCQTCLKTLEEVLLDDTVGVC